MSPRQNGDPEGSQPNRELSELLLRACHDLKTPLRAIRAHSELLVRKSGSTPALDGDQSLAFIIEGSRQADRLVESITNYAIALQTDPATFQPMPMDVILRSALARLASALKEQHAEVKYANLPRIAVNADRMIQLFENLVENSLRYRGAADPRIDITAQQQDGVWQFSVQDNGPGVEPESLQRIFRPFERLHGKDRPGFGMGLAICRVIVESHGGTIWAESTVGEGCVVRFTLPAD